MRPLTAGCTIDVPREQVFDYLVDVANHTEFTDHCFEDFRLERLDSRGVGAAASFRLKLPLGSVWAEIVVAEAERPHRIRLEGGAGRLRRVKFTAIYTLTLYDREMTSVDYQFTSTPATRSDALKETLGGRIWLSFQTRRALRRLKRVLEQGQPSVGAVRVAAG